MVRTAGERGTRLALLVLDVDRLKALNDRHGHVTGAEAVRTVGHLIAERLPPEAVACRYGGDEFVIAVPEGGLPGGQQLAEDLRRTVLNCAPVLAGRAFDAGTLSISVGVASAAFAPDADPGDRAGGERADGEALFTEADAALYRAKANGPTQLAPTSSELEPQPP